MDEDIGGVTGGRDVRETLATDPLFAVLGARLATPYALGIVLGILIVLMVLFGPSTDSRFIYTDF